MLRCGLFAVVIGCAVIVCSVLFGFCVLLVCCVLFWVAAFFPPICVCDAFLAVACTVCLLHCLLWCFCCWWLLYFLACYVFGCCLSFWGVVGRFVLLWCDLFLAVFVCCGVSCVWFLFAFVVVVFVVLRLLFLLFVCLLAFLFFACSCDWFAGCCLPLNCWGARVFFVVLFLYCVVLYVWFVFVFVCCAAWGVWLLFCCCC